LLFGIPNPNILYKEELEQLQQQNLTTSASLRYQPPEKQSGRMYIQDRVAEHAEELWA